MDWFTGIVLYVLIWWTTLFAVLPFGTKPVADADPTTGWRGAPERAVHLPRKVIATTAGRRGHLGRLLPGHQRPVAELPPRLAGAATALSVRCAAGRGGAADLPRQSPRRKRSATIFCRTRENYSWTTRCSISGIITDRKRRSSSCRVTGVSSLNLARRARTGARAVFCLTRRTAVLSPAFVRRTGRCNAIFFRRTSLCGAQLLLRRCCSAVRSATSRSCQF